MNKIYRLIWNPALHAWVAVGEFAKAKGKKNGINSATIITGVALLILSPLNTAHAWMIDSTGQVINAGSPPTDNNREDNTAIGSAATVSGTAGVAVGEKATASGDNGVAIGSNALASGATGSTAIGSNSRAGSDAVAIGVNASARTMESVAIGSQSKANDNKTISIGSSSFTNAEGAIALGNGAGVLSSDTTFYNIAIGYEAGQSGSNEKNTSIGYRAGQSVSGLHNVALGDEAGSGVSASYTLSLGTKAKANANSAIAIGNGATSDNDFSVALGSNATTAAAVGTPSITLLGVTRNFAGTTPIGTVSVGNLGAERTLTNVAAGRISNTSTDAINGSQLYAVNDAVTQLNETAVQYNYTLDPNTGDRTPDYSSITLNGGTGGTTITNVAAGVNDSDAVNFGQLTDAINNITINPTSNIKYFHANSSGSDSVASGTDSVAVGPDAHSNANNSMALGNGAVANHEGSVALGAGSVTDTTKPQGTTGVDIRGDHYDFAGTAPTSTVSVGAAGMERTVSNVAAGQISATSTDAINGSQLYATNLAIENINASMANIGQDSMFQVNNTSNLPKPVPTGKDAIAGGAGASATAENSMAIGTQAQSSHTNAVAIGANSVTDRDNSVSVGASGNERQITNVAAGTQATDAVNVSQLQQSIGNTYQYTNGKFNELKNMIDDQNDKLSAGIAGAMAMASLPQPWAPGASIVGMGGGTYQGESAISLGVSTISDNGRWVSKLSGSTNSQGDVGAAIGLGYQW